MAEESSVLRECKKWLSGNIYRTLTLISPYWNTQIRFWRTAGHFIDLKNPRTFTEKLTWLKLYRYAHDPLVMQCADKVRVREYVKEKGLEQLLIPEIAVYSGAEEVKWDALPEQFVLKWNFGCGANLICRSKRELDIPWAVRTLRKWGRTPYWLEYSELQYRIKEKRILCEQYLETAPGEELLDYKFYCFHGKPLAILVIARPAEGEKAAVLMSTDWELISDIPDRYSKTFLPEKPGCLKEMLHAAEILSEPFPFVRVDLYDHQGRPFFGELTFTPAAAIFPSEALLNGKSMGEYIDLNKETK